MGDDSKRYPYDAPVETEGMGGAGGGDIDDVGDVGYPRRGSERDVTGGRGIPEGMGGAGGGDLDDLGDVGTPEETRNAGVSPAGISRDAGMSRELGGETGVVTGITTGSATDDAAEGPGSPWENLDDDLRESAAGETNSPTT